MRFLLIKILNVFLIRTQKHTKGNWVWIFFFSLVEKVVYLHLLVREASIWWRNIVFKWGIGFADQRFIKVAKSPNSPPLAFPFVVTPTGISLRCDEGIEVIGPHIQTIHCQGMSLWLCDSMVLNLRKCMVSSGAKYSCMSMVFWSILVDGIQSG